MLLPAASVMFLRGYVLSKKYSSVRSIGSIGSMGAWKRKRRLKETGRRFVGPFDRSFGNGDDPGRGGAYEI
jgi:hypothetical protein